MTIALAAYGPNAGKAIADGLLAAEILGRGAVGGFVVFSALDLTGVHRQFCCQDGGLNALPDHATLFDTRCAAVISSGPNRPVPLSQFLAGQSGLGLVTGHRLPNKSGRGGLPVNRAVLELMAQDMTPAEALGATLHANAQLDVGLIAVKPEGPLACGNTDRVNNRKDALFASRQTDGMGYAMLCNSIFSAPNIQLEKVVGAIMWGCLCEEEAPYFIAELQQPVPIYTAEADQIEIDQNNNVIRVESGEPNILQSASRTTLVHNGALVMRSGHCVGMAVSEVFATVAEGRAKPLDASQTRFIAQRI